MADVKQGKFFRFFEDMPPAARGLVIVGAVGVTAFVVVSIVNALKKKKNQDAANAPIMGAGEDLKVLAQNHVYPTYVSADYQGFASSLKYALDGCNVNTDTIYSIFDKMKNTADINSLIIAWGTRKISPCFINVFDVQFGTLNLFTGTPDMSLPQAIQAAGQYEKGMVAKINSMLSANGVNYQF